MRTGTQELSKPKLRVRSALPMSGNFLFSWLFLKVVEGLKKRADLCLVGFVGVLKKGLCFEPPHLGNKDEPGLQRKKDQDCLHYTEENQSLRLQGVPLPMVFTNGQHFTGAPQDKVLCSNP